MAQTFDAVGNLVDDGRDYKYIYDAFGRLVEVTDQSDNTVAAYGYNGLNHRISWHYDVTGSGGGPVSDGSEGVEGVGRGVATSRGTYGLRRWRANIVPPA